MNEKFIVTGALFAFLFLSGTLIQAQTVSTYAGSTTSGSYDGIGTAATFYGPMDVVRDASGNFYIADVGNNKIRKIDATTLAVTTFAGTGALGREDGNRLSATFNGPENMVFDASGNLFIADKFNNSIRKIDMTTGIVSTFAGSLIGNLGNVNGTVNNATFYYPSGLVFDASGNLFVTEEYGHTIRKITPSAVVTTFAGSITGASGSNNGTGTSARFSYPWDITIDASDNLFVTEWGNKIVRKITPAAVVTTFAGSAGNSDVTDGTGLAARFVNPLGITTSPTGDMYVTDGNRIRKITSGAVVTTYAGNSFDASGSNDGPASTAKFYNGRGLISDSAGNLYISDQNNNEIRKISPTIPLALNWISINGSLNNMQQSQINWQVNENNVAEFQIEKSKDGTNFTYIGTINSIGIGMHSYVYTDAATNKELAYYRIKEVDKSGEYNYSLVIKIQNSLQESGDITIYPNPFSVTFIVNSKITQLATVYNIQGQIEQIVKLHEGDNNIDISTLSNGTYFLKTAGGTRKAMIKK